MIKFKADRVKIHGPKIDGGYSVTFEVGEYEQEHVAELLTIHQNTTMSVEVINDQ